MDKPVDPALSQLHMYVCMMIELAGYAETESTLTVFELCKRALREYVKNFPVAQSVCTMYASIPNPHAMPDVLAKNNYTDKYVEDVNDILQEIFLEDDLDHAFKQLATIT